MRILQKTEYGLRAVLDLASQPPGVLAKACEIALRQDIPLKFLELLLELFGKADWWKLAEAPHGGYRLAKPSELISVGQVLLLLGDPIERTRRHDAFTDMWQQIDTMALDILFSTTFASLAAKAESPLSPSPMELVGHAANLLDAVS